MLYESFLLKTGGRQFFVTVNSHLQLSIFTQGLSADYFFRIVKTAHTTHTHVSQVLPSPQSSHNLMCIAVFHRSLLLSNHLFFSKGIDSQNERWLPQTEAVHWVRTFVWYCHELFTSRLQVF